MISMLSVIRSRPATALQSGLLSLTATLAATGPAQAQLLPGLTGAVTVGCPYRAYTTDSRNTGFLDENATYGVAQIPLSLPPGASIRIEGKFPKVRYFSQQSYDGATGGNFIDAMADARISSTSGGVINSNVADLPTGGAYGDSYTLTLRYQNPPANPAQRLPNVLYVGAPSNNVLPTRVAKQIIYRIYAPNPGENSLGGQPLPRLVYTDARGEIDFRNTPDARKCERIEALSELSATVNPGILPNRNIKFEPVSRTQDRILYPNGDSNYLRAAASLNYGKIVVVRAKRMKTPLLLPLVEPATETRYLSLCQYQLLSSAVESCFLDRGVIAQQDDHVVYVISPAADRPVKATTAFGYNWKSWGSTRGELLILRQILPKPGFAGDYGRAVARPEIPLHLTLGVYAPQISYCDAATFNAYAASGGASLLAACQQASARLF